METKHKKKNIYVLLIGLYISICSFLSTNFILHNNVQFPHFDSDLLVKRTVLHNFVLCFLGGGGVFILCLFINVGSVTGQQAVNSAPKK